ncbi:hypothetical protein Syun_015362 [Stephania yunnanensis]|uniref:Uncharacterized protein n=1 Tax=Stephania yunnanensis TaxID=152371 RepID=A0AAP0JL72_9MAGN
MGWGDWSVYDGVKTIPRSPEALMAEIDAAIAALEYARAAAAATTTAADEPCPSPPSPPQQYDARLADEAYREGCAALAAGKLDEALQSLQISLSKCPPNKTSALAKLRSLISLTSHQVHHHHHRPPLPPPPPPPPP